MANLVEILFKGTDEASGPTHAVANSLKTVGESASGAKGHIVESGSAIEMAGHQASSAKGALEEEAGAHARVGAEAGGSSFQVHEAGASTEEAGGKAHEAEGKFSGLKEQLGGLATVAGGMVAGSVLMSVTGGLEEQFAGVTTEVAAYSEQVRNLSVTTGMTSEQSSHLVLAFKDMGIPVDSGTQAMGRWSKALETAQLNIDKGSKTLNPVQQMYKDMGISIDDSSGKLKPFDVLLGETADKFKDMPDGIQKTGIAMTLFGRSAGPDMVTLLNQGSEGLKEIAANADKYGITLTAGNVVAARQFVLAHKDMDAAVEGVRIQIGNFMIPVMTTLTETLSNVVTKVVPFVEHWADVISKSAPVQAAMSGIREAIEKVPGAFEAVKTAIGNFKDLVGTLIGDTIDPIKKALANVHLDIGSGSGDALKGLKDVLGDIGTKLKSFVPEPLASLATGIGNAIAKVIEIGAAFKSSEPAVTAVAVVLGLIATVRIAQFVAAIPGMLAQMGAWIAAHWAQAAAAGAAAIAEMAAILPILLIGAALAAVVIIIVEVIKHHEQLGAAFSALGVKAHELVDAIGKVFSDIGTKIHDAIQGIMDWLKDHWELIVGILTGPIGIAVIEIVKHGDAIKAVFTGIFGPGGAIGQTFSAFGTALNGVFGPGGIVAGAFSAAGTTIHDFLQKASDFWNQIWDGMANKLNAIWLTISGYVREGINKVITMLDGLIGAFNSLKFTFPAINIDAGPLQVKFGGASWAVPQMPTLPLLTAATGTDFSPGGPTLVGEQGPEIMNVPRGSSILPAAQTAQALQQPTVININLPVGSVIVGTSAELASMVRDQLLVLKRSVPNLGLS